MLAKELHVNRVFQALGDPTRRAILERVSERPFAASHLAQPLNISVAAVVQHLQLLEACGLVKTEKIGRVRTCRLEPGGLSLAAEWISERQALWERRLDRLGDLLAEGE